MPDDVKNIWTKAGLAKRSNVFMFVLDSKGQLVHGFNAVRSGARGKEGVSDSQQEITIALGKLKLADTPAAETPAHPVVLPDLDATTLGIPAGVRMYIRPNNRGQQLVVEVVKMQPEEWKILSFPETARPIKPDALKNWLVQMYPPAIRTADQKKPFTKITGSVTIEPAGADGQGRYALLRGEVRLAKGDENESEFQGRLEAVLTYRAEVPDVQSLQGVVEGDYLYRVRGTQAVPLIAAIESRPDPHSTTK